MRTMRAGQTVGGRTLILSEDFDTRTGPPGAGVGRADRLNPLCRKQHRGYTPRRPALFLLSQVIDRLPG